MKAVVIIAAIVWVASNLIVSKKLSACQLKKLIYGGGCMAGKIFASLYYSPAWFLKGVRAVVLATIK